MTQIPSSDVPGMGRRQFMNLLTFGSVTGVALGALYPVARYFISGWGTLGLVWFKIAMVTLILFATQAIALRRPAVAQLILNGATLFVGSVVAYSGFLLVQNRI